MMSCVGVMFAPHHQAGADELVRVCRPGGTIGLSPGRRGIHRPDVRHHEALRPAAASRSAAAAAVGHEDHVRELLGDRVERRPRLGRRCGQALRAPEDFRDYFKTNYGPTIAVYRGLAEDPERVAALDRDLAELARRFDIGTDSYVLDWEYLIFICRKR